MTHEHTDILICGAGIAGISTAYHLTVNHGLKDVLIVDERHPLTLTSDKSTECYRNWWPGPGDGMVRLMNRSIDIMESLAQESDNFFHLTQRGYLYVTADPARVDVFRKAGEEAEALGAGPLRCHEGNARDPRYRPARPRGWAGGIDGSDLILDSSLIREHFPYLTEKAVAVLHARRCGWLSAQQLGMYMLERAKDRGARYMQGRITGIHVKGGRVEGVEMERRGSGRFIGTDVFVNAAGPFVARVAGMMGIRLPVFSELHAKVAFNDHRGVLPREAPLIIWTDAQTIPWTSEERDLVAESEEGRRLLGVFPPGAHMRPEGGPGSASMIMLWAYDTPPVEPVFPPDFDSDYPEVALRGLSRMVPDLEAYFGRIPRPFVDGGYYTKTRENRPLIQPLPVSGAYVIGALSGFGIMASCAAGELLSACITRSPLPSYAPCFTLERYRDPAYVSLLDAWDESGQL